jgi:hypothetical protein
MDRANALDLMLGDLEAIVRGDTNNRGAQLVTA